MNLQPNIYKTKALICEFVKCLGTIARILQISLAFPSLISLFGNEEDVEDNLREVKASDDEAEQCVAKNWTINRILSENIIIEPVNIIKWSEDVVAKHNTENLANT